MLRELKKQLILRLKTSSQYRNLQNNYFIIAIALTILALATKIYFLALLLIFFLFYIKQKNKKMLYIIVIVSLIFFFHFLVQKFYYCSEEKTTLQGKVIDVQKKQNSNLLIIRKNFKKYYIYVPLTDYQADNIKPGDICHIEGESLEILTQRIEGGFDYRQYLLDNKVVSGIVASEVTIIKKRISINIIKYYLYQYIDNTFNDEAKMIIKGFILGDDYDFTDEFSEAIKKNAIMHLFAVSGLHVNILGIFLIYLGKILHLKEKKVNLFITIVLAFYTIVTSFRASIIRAALLFYFHQINEKYQLNLSSLDRLSIIYILLLLINPLYIYNLGFILSFLMTFFISLYSPLIKKNSPVMQTFKISLFAQIITLPIVLNINPTINILSPFANVIFIYLVTLLILPLTFIVTMFPFLQPIYQIIITGFVNTTILFSNTFTINISFSEVPNMIMISYYLIVVFFLTTKKRKKMAISLFVILALSFYLYPLTKKNTIHFLDLENGESTVINDKECVAVIDTGDGTNHETTSFLKRQGIKRIDYLFLTHNHFDHNGEASYIIREIKVNNIVVSAYDNSDVVKMNKVTRVAKGDRITCGEIVFEILGPDSYHEDENDNSLIIKTQIGDLNYLFLGDVTKKGEEQLINSLPNIDVIKIAHHGSSTSTSQKLLDALRPKYAIIMAGRIKKFGFPHQPTIATLNKYPTIIYRTDQNYSIKCKYNKKDSIFSSLK